MITKKQPTISILITAYNEERHISRCVESCLKQKLKPEEIIVVNDGSKDRTVKILESYADKITIINLPKNTGNKSKAQEIGIKYIKTDIFITTDADTCLHPNFTIEILKSFSSNNITAVSGFVESKKGNWLTKVREINYLIGQTIFKTAQDYVGALYVLVGCGSAFKTDDFKKIIKFDHDNVTEDLDFTYKFKIADKKIILNKKAIVYTQDPNNLRSYFRQLYRWHSGGWYCLKKNFRIMKKPNNALILSLIYLEGLIMGLAIILSPFLILISYRFFLIFILLSIIVTSLSASYGILKYKKYSLFFYLPFQILLAFPEQILFLYTFAKEIILNNKNLYWYKADRY